MKIIILMNYFSVCDKLRAVQHSEMETELKKRRKICIKIKPFLFHRTIRVIGKSDFCVNTVSYSVHISMPISSDIVLALPFPL